MPKQTLKYQIEPPKPEDFIWIPSLRMYIAKNKARRSDSEKILQEIKEYYKRYRHLTDDEIDDFIREYYKDGFHVGDISWFDAKLLVQSLNTGSDSITYSFPSSSEWDKIGKYLHQNYPEVEKEFRRGLQWVDSLLAFPDKKGKYDPRLQISGIKKGKVPLLIDHPKVEKLGKSYIIKEGELTRVTEVPEFPVEIDHAKWSYVQAWDEDLGLPTKVGEKPSKEFEEGYAWISESGLRAILRGRNRFDILIEWDPSYDLEYLPGSGYFHLAYIPKRQ
jgi:hypothetical protein